MECWRHNLFRSVSERHKIQKHLHRGMTAVADEVLVVVVAVAGVGAVGVFVKGFGCQCEGCLVVDFGIPFL